MKNEQVFKGTVGVHQFDLRDRLPDDVAWHIIGNYCTGRDLMRLQDAIYNRAPPLEPPALKWRKKRYLQGRLELACKNRKPIPNLMEGIVSIPAVSRRLF